MWVYPALTMTKLPDTLSELITVKEAAELLGVSDRRVRYMIGEQKIEAKKLGAGHLPYLVVRSSVQAFIEKQKERDQAAT